MSFLDNLQSNREGALLFAETADWTACLDLWLVEQYRHKKPDKAAVFAETWMANLKRAHYWLMYVMALEVCDENAL